MYLVGGGKLIECVSGGVAGSISPDAPLARTGSPLPQRRSHSRFLVIMIVIKALIVSIIVTVVIQIIAIHFCSRTRHP